MTEPMCAAACGVPLSRLNIIQGDPVHEDCRCLYRDCRKPMTDRSWLRLATAKLPRHKVICPKCWDDPAKTFTVKA